MDVEPGLAPEKLAPGGPEPEATGQRRGGQGLKAQVVGHRDGALHVQRVAHQQHRAYARRPHQVPGALQVLPGIARLDVDQNRRAGNPVHDGVMAPHLRFRGIARLGAAAGEDDPVHPSLLVQRDGFIDALAIDRRRLVAPGGGAQHHGGIGQGDRRLVPKPNDLPCDYGVAADQEEKRQGDGFEK